MSLWTCIACSARRAVGALLCPQCGAAEHEEGDTVSEPEGGQGQRHIPAPFADTPPAPAMAPAAVTAVPATLPETAAAADEPADEPPATDTPANAP